jgi:ArsR family transcriptional regulator, cadmium/lead-responsive transcriptional repressor
MYIASIYRRLMAIDSTEFEPAAALFRSLGDITRLAIVRLLADGEARVVDLADELGSAQSTVSRHLARLRDCGLVDFRADGRQSFYTLTRPDVLDVLAAAQTCWPRPAPRYPCAPSTASQSPPTSPNERREPRPTDCAPTPKRRISRVPSHRV